MVIRAQSSYKHEKFLLLIQGDLKKNKSRPLAFGVSTVIILPLFFFFFRFGFYGPSRLIYSVQGNPISGWVTRVPGLNHTNTLLQKVNLTWPYSQVIRCRLEVHWLSAHLITQPGGLLITLAKFFFINKIEKRCFLIIIIF